MAHLNIESTNSSSRPSKKWPSGVGALSGKMEPFEIGNDVCTYSSSSSSDEDEDLFKMEEKTAPTEQPETIKSEETSAPKKVLMPHFGQRLRPILQLPPLQK